MSSPRVSICIPTYNNASFIAETLESALAQSFTDFELLVRDDCSTDNTREIVDNYRQLDRRIKLTVNCENLGMVNNWNAVLSEARGEYVRFLFGDDLLASADAIREMVVQLDADPGISLIASARYLVDERSVKTATAAAFSGSRSFIGTDVVNRCLFEQKNLIGEPSIVMFRKSQACRGFDPNFSQFVDMEMWFHLLEQGKFYFINEPLASFRIHSEQQTKRNVSNLVHIEEMFCLMDDYFTRPYVTMGSVVKEFLKYHQSYRIWKAFKSSKLNRDEALAKISLRCSSVKFFALLPLYKLLSPFWKLYCLVCLPKASL